MESPRDKEKQFEILIKTHSGIINSVCYFYASAKVPFEDLRQEVFVNLWHGIDSFRNECKVSTWIYRIAVNTALMALRSSGKKVVTLPIDSALINNIEDDCGSRRESLENLNELISKLDTIEKAIILLWLDDCSYQEIADTMGLTKNNVAIKIHRIKNKLSESK